MSSREGQLQSEAMLNGAQEEAMSRIFALDPGEGEAVWWMGGLATIKATKEQTGGHYTLVEILVPELPMEESLLHLHHFEDDKGEPRLVPLRAQGHSPRLLGGLGACKAVVHPLARGLRGPHQGDGRAG